MKCGNYILFNKQKKNTLIYFFEKWYLKSRINWQNIKRKIGILFAEYSNKGNGIILINLLRTILHCEV